MIDADTLAHARAASLLQQIMRLGRLADAEAVRRLATRGGPTAHLRTAHTRLLPHIALTGTRPVELARKVGVSKQAIGPLVDDLVAAGVMARVPDPADGRVVLIRWTPQGRAAMLDGLAVLGGLEAELADRLGAEALATLHALVDRALAHAETWEAPTAP